MKKGTFVILCLLCAMFFTGCDPQAAHRPTGQWEWNGANTKIFINFEDPLTNTYYNGVGYIEEDGEKKELFILFGVSRGLRFFYMNGNENYIGDYDHCTVFSGIYLWGIYDWNESKSTLTFTSAPIVNRDASLKLVFHQVESAE